MKTAILDTDFLINCVKNNIHFVEEIKKICDFKVKLCILNKTFDELENKENFKLIKEIIDKENICIIKTEKNKNVDDLILDIVNENYVVATQDQELKRKLKEKGISIITIRQKNYLVLQ